MAETPRKQAKKAPAKPTARKSTAAKKPATGKTAKHNHAQLVRDSFTIPEDEYSLLGETKKDCLAAGFDIKKSELIRIGIALMYDLSTSQLKKAQQSLQPVKTGRPKKHK